MSMTDPVADLLVRLKNALQAGFPNVECPASNLKTEVCRVLKEEGYIRDFVREDDGTQGTLKISLKYARDREPVIQGIRRVSKPSLRVYAGSEDIRQVMSGLGITILTTSKGVMTGKSARTQKVGGEVLCEVW